MSEVVGNYMYVAFRQSYAQNRLLIVKYDLIKDIYTEKILVPDCSSRPCFLKRSESELYLMNNLHGRKNISILQIDTTRLIESREILNINNLSCYYFYPLLYGNNIYMTYTGIGVNYASIKFSNFTINKYSEEDILNKFYTLFN